MEPVIKDKSVLKREWYMMGYQDAALKILTALNEACYCNNDGDFVVDIKEICKLAKENGVDLDSDNSSRIAFIENFGVDLNQ